MLTPVDSHTATTNENIEPIPFIKVSVEPIVHILGSQKVSILWYTRSSQFVGFVFGHVILIHTSIVSVPCGQFSRSHVPLEGAFAPPTPPTPIALREP